MQLVVHSAGGLLVLLGDHDTFGTRTMGQNSLRTIRPHGYVSTQTPPAYPDLDNETTSDGSPLRLKRFLPVIVVIFVAFVAVHLVLLHLIAGGLGSHGH